MVEPQLIVAHILHIVGVGVNEGRLNQAEDVGRGDVLLRIAFSPPVVAEVVGIAHVAHVDAGREAAPEIDVGVEADVQTVEVGLLGCGV